VGQESLELRARSCFELPLYEAYSKFYTCLVLTQWAMHNRTQNGKDINEL